MKRFALVLSIVLSTPVLHAQQVEALTPAGAGAAASRRRFAATSARPVDAAQRNGPFALLYRALRSVA